VAGNALCRQLQQQLHDQLLASAGGSPQSKPWFVGGYLPSRGEIDVLPTLTWLRSQGHITCLPVMRKINEQPGLRFAPFDDASTLIPGKFNIPVPDLPDSALLTAEQLDLVLVPLTGFDEQGNRLGMGGGYYDRTFAWRQQQTHSQRYIGVAHECQKMTTLPVDTWDVPLDAIATDRHWYNTTNTTSSEGG